MHFKNKSFQKFWRFSTSFQLGIPILVALTTLIIWGTLVEAQFDAWTAGKRVYQSWMMYAVMGLLIYNLVIVMVDRLPWKLNHYPFILVHIGIITMIFGGWVTQTFGLDGNLVIPIHKSNHEVMTALTGVTVYATFDGSNYRVLHDKEIDFYNEPVSSDRPLEFFLNNKNLKVVRYVPYARANQKIVTTEDKTAGSSVRFQLSNANVKQVESLTQQNKNKVSETTLGLLHLYLGYQFKALGRKNIELNELYFNALDENNVEVTLFKKSEKKPFKTGIYKIGDVVPTPWMGLEVRLLDYLQKAKSKWEVEALDHPNALTTSAIQIEFGQVKEWVLLNDVVKVFTDTEAYLISYNNRRVRLDFEIALDEFKMTSYQGIRKAKEYSSRVTVKDKNTIGGDFREEALISMNEPLKYQGFTFYQASFEQDEKTGQAVATVLSVNKDPGRWIKYLGSLILTFGIVWLFYQRRKRRTAL